ncbi:vanadium-dependent haloperoxidase [Rubrivivax sp. RP6-9]|uniref:vanadium-dependent haloperoxidase n=1 Tax=Rubrivivax sp. RP6-9 TaxID=3415750 RepID=UPI003CC6CBD3
MTEAMAVGRSAPTVASRALSMVYEATYNAWACFDRDARQTLPGLPRERDPVSREALASLAVSAAARDVLSNLYADQTERFADQWERHKARWWKEAGVVAAPVALRVGELCASRLLQQRLQDGSNQTGDLASGAYADYTGYKPVNSPDLVVDPLRWQPLRVSNGQGGLVDQKCTTPHWGLVRPFALPAGSIFRPSLSRLAPSVADVQDVLRRSATLGDLEKANADFWAGRPGSPPPPGIWNQIAAQIAAEDGQSLSQDVKMLFLLGQAMLDTSIAVWDAKVHYDSVRPITWIRTALQGQMVRAWAGPGAGTQFVRAEDWLPFQPETFVTPPFQEIVSGHSAFSAAAAGCLGAWRGDHFELRAVVPAGSSEVEPGSPSREVTLRWSSLREAAEAAGLSRRQGGIHFIQGDLKGRELGLRVARRVLERAGVLFGAGSQAVRAEEPG